MVCISCTAIYIAATHLVVTDRLGGFYPFIPIETSTVSFCSSVFLVLLFLNSKVFTWTLKCLFLQGVWVPNTLVFRLLQIQCAAYPVFLSDNRALCSALRYRWYTNLFRDLLQCLRLFQCFKWAIWIADLLRDFNYSQKATKARLLIF